MRLCFFALFRLRPDGRKFSALRAGNALRGGTFVRRQKYPKAPCPSAESCNFGEHSLRERPSCNKADGKTLAKGRRSHSITRYDPVCRCKLCQHCAFIGRLCLPAMEMRSLRKLLKSANPHCKSTQCALNAPRMQSFHRHRPQYLAFLCTFPLSSVAFPVESAPRVAHATKLGRKKIKKAENKENIRK